MKARLYWMIFAVIFCLAIAMGLQSYIQLKANIMQEVPQRQNAIAHTVAMVVESFIQRQAATIENLAGREEILLSTKTFNHTPGINLLQKYNAEFDKLSYISRHGRLLYSVENSIASQTSADLSSTPFYRYMRQSPNEVVIDVLPAEQQIARNVIRMGIHKVNYFDKPLHSICAEVNPLALDKLLNLIDTGPDTSVLIVNNQGLLLSKKLNSLQTVPDKADTEKLMTKLSNPAGVFENRLIRLRTTEHLVNGYSLEKLNWHVILITPTKVIYAPLKQLLKNSVLTVLLVLLIGMLLALVISRNIFKPIAMLTSLAEDAADNLSLEERLRWHKRDELGSLAGTFNKMLDRLQHAFATLSNHQSHLVAAQELAKVGYFQKLKHSDTIQLSFELTRILQTNPDTLCGLFECIHHEDRCALKSAIQETIASKKTHIGKCRAVSPDKKIIHIQYHLKAFEENHELCMMGTFHDITELQESQQQLKFLAYNDLLTGLPNRTYFNEKLSQAISLANREEYQVALLFLDLDNFKDINDSFGHIAGDAVLKETACRIHTCLRAEDSISRMGGDEFIIIMEAVHSTASISFVADKILQALKQPFCIADNHISISASIGISIYPDNGLTQNDLLTNADTALYRAKNKGRNNYQFYKESLTEQLREELLLTNELRAALDTDQGIFIHFQPQVRGTDASLQGFEVLVRWEHPEKGMIPPDKFIPIAERSDLISKIGLKVIEESCRQLQLWQTEGLSDNIRLAINVSGIQLLQPDFKRQLRSILQKYRVSPQSIELELTESCLIDSASGILERLQELKAAGFTLAIDDFGTGYSSLSYLKRFPIDKLKIDRSFVDGLPYDPEDQSITQAIIALSHSMHMTVIAEGVETTEQHIYLNSLGCEEFQGYYFSRPVSAEQASQIIREPYQLLPPAENNISRDVICPS